MCEYSTPAVFQEVTISRLFLARCDVIVKRLSDLQMSLFTETRSTLCIVLVAPRDVGEFLSLPACTHSVFNLERTGFVRFACIEGPQMRNMASRRDELTKRRGSNYWMCPCACLSFLFYSSPSLPGPLIQHTGEGLCSTCKSRRTRSRKPIPLDTLG